MLLWKDGVHSNIWYPCVWFGDKQACYNRLKSVLKGSGVLTNMSNTSSRTENHFTVLRDLTSTPFLLLGTYYKYQIIPPMMSVLASNWKHWQMGWRGVCNKRGLSNIKELIKTVGYIASESEEDLEEAKDVLDERWRGSTKEKNRIIVTRYLLVVIYTITQYYHGIVNTENKLRSQLCLQTVHLISLKRVKIGN